MVYEVFLVCQQQEGEHEEGASSTHHQDEGPQELCQEFLEYPMFENTVSPHIVSCCDSLHHWVSCCQDGQLIHAVAPSPLPPAKLNHSAGNINP